MYDNQKVDARIQAFFNQYPDFVLLVLLEVVTLPLIEPTSRFLLLLLLLLLLLRFAKVLRVSISSMDTCIYMLAMSSQQSGSRI